MNKRDQIYLRLLHLGLLAIREATADANLEWAGAEAEFLHNIPSLIGETKVERHKYFWNVERVMYLEWISAHGGEKQKFRLDTRYQTVLKELLSLIEDT